MPEIVWAIAVIALVGYVAVAVICARSIDQMASRKRLGWTGLAWAIAICAFWPVVFVLAIGRKRKGER